jgi:hypothetical protein
MDAHVTIRPAAVTDWNRMWRILRSVVATEPTYIFPPDTPEDEARGYWFAPGVQSWVADSDGDIVGFYRTL